MFDSILNIMIVLIPLAIFVGRAVSQARARRAPPQPPPQIPVHFEDEDDYEYEFFGGMVNDAVQVPKPVSRQAPRPATTIVPPLIETSFTAAKGKVVPASEQTAFPLNLSKLSPMKQAVVMAEILGPPKAFL